MEPSRAVTRHGTVRASYVAEGAGGVHRGPGRAPPGLAAHEQQHGRHRAAPGRGLGGDRLAGRGGARRRGALLLLRPAHRRRADRHRRPRCALPVRLRGTTTRDAPSRRRSPELRAILHQHFPAAAGVPLEHAWSGVLGVPRDWCATVRLDRETGLGWAGGYVGHGVTVDQPGGPHDARPRARAGHRPDRAAVGGPAGARLGAGAAALARRPWSLRRLPRRRPARGPRHEQHLPDRQVADRISGR